jgi:metal-dependent amidase/aminoacylase/carboxypeptidase family protein
VAAAAVLCAVALAPLLAEVGVELRVLGTPAEEGGGGKVTRLDEGVFDGLDAVLMVHPAPHDMLRPSILAMEMLDVEFRGFRPPSMNPELGYSAGDGVTLVQVGVGLMRQHLRAADRVTGVILEEGFAANALPDRARMRFVLRAPTIAALAPVRERFVNVVNGAALASGTTCSITSPHPAYDGMRHDGLLSELYGANARALGRSFPDESAADAARSASTDFGNVSQRVRAIHPLIGVQSDGFSNHQAEFTDICRGATGDDAVFAGAVAMAWTIVDFAAPWVSSHREQEA